jgi:hypothetical protein
VRLAVSERLASRLAVPSCALKNCAAAARERREFNAQTCMTASGMIRQPGCPKFISLLIVFRKRNT